MNLRYRYTGIFCEAVRIFTFLEVTTTVGVRVIHPSEKRAFRSERKRRPEGSCYCRPKSRSSFGCAWTPFRPFFYRSSLRLCAPRLEWCHLTERHVGNTFQWRGAPQPSDIIGAAAGAAMEDIRGVDDSVLSLYKDAAEEVGVMSG